MKRPVLIYDGDCGFCVRWVERWRARTGEAVDYLPSREAAVQFPHIPPEKFAKSVVLREPDGRYYTGAEAVFRSLARCPGGKKWLWMYRRIPGFALVSEGTYRFIARHRMLFSRATRLLCGGRLAPSTYFFSRWLFLRSLGAIYLIAFVSLNGQVTGLIGENGILPTGDFLEAVEEQMPGWRRFWQAPTLAWLGAGDEFLRFLCWGGAVLSAIAVVGFAQPAVFFLLWLFYLSLAVVAREFLSFQWDVLLLETGLLAVFAAPWGSLKRWGRPAFPLARALSEEPPPSPVVMWLLRWLLFRLMFQSAAVKLLSGDPLWRGLLALTVHYETQPLPTWIGWYAHQMPAWFQKISCAGMFFVEGIVPFLIFLPCRAKQAAALAFAFLMLLIALTGNYTFFNLLTLALCLPLLEDAFWRRTLPERNLPPEARVKRWFIGALAAGVLLVSGILLAGMFRRRQGLPPALYKVYTAVSPLRSINSYGLFAVMTPARPEIVLEGSNDGKTWTAYEFKYKPGDPKRRPGFVAPHQPRLDWQMWFEALNAERNGRPSPWFLRLCEQLLRNSPEVVRLLEKNPFPDKPPRYLRAALYDYRFTDLSTKRTEGSWWRRKLRGFYTPALALRHP